MKAGVAVLLLVAALPEAARAQDKRLAQLLAAVATYVETYEPQLSAMVAQEDYTQTVRRGPERDKQHSISDFLFLKLPGATNWVGFRDVYSVDGEPVREKEDRFSAILKSGEDVEKRAAELAAESARYNLGWVVRQNNNPTLVLGWLARDVQRRFVFELEGRKSVSGTRCQMVRFREVETPTLIRGRDFTNLISSGSFCATDDGRVWRTEHQPPGRVAVAVTYAFDPQFAMLVPSEMQEEYGAERIQCVARYSKYRRFSVTTRIR